MDRQTINKKRFNIKRSVAIIIILMLIINMVSPYSILFNTEVQAVSYVMEDKPIIFNNLGITTKGANRMLTVEIAISSETMFTGVDINFKVDLTRLTPCNRNTGAANSTITLISKTSDYYAGSMLGRHYNSETGVFDMTCVEGEGWGIDLVENGYVPGEFGDPAIDDNGAGLSTYYPISTFYFKILDDTITEGNIPADLFELVPIGVALPTGLTVTWINDYGGNSARNITFNMLGFTVEEEVKTVSSIAVKTNPNNTNYNHGDTIDLTGGKLEITYADASTEEIDMTDSNVTISGGTPADINNQTITLKYEGKTTSLALTVNDPVDSLIITTPMSDVEYDEEESFITTGMEFRATKRSGATVDLEETDVTISETIASVNSENFTQTSTEGETPKRGTQDVIFTYNGATAIQSVIVNDSVASLNVLAQPTKTAYKLGENLDLTGAQVRLNMTSGDNAIINLPNGSIDVTGYSNTTYGVKQNLSVKYGEITSTETINVEAYNYITASLFSRPSTDKVNYNETLDLTGGKFTLTWKDSSDTNIITTVPLTSEDITVTYDNKIIGIQYADVVYNVVYTLSDSTTINDIITRTLKIEVMNPAESIIITAPTKTVFNHGDTLTFDGGNINVKYIDGGELDNSITSTVVKDTVTGLEPNMTPTEAEYGISNVVTRNLIISYSEDGVLQTETYDVNIINDVKSIAMVSPTTNYNVNEPITGSITVTRAVGTEEINLTDSRVTITGDTQTEGTAIPVSITFEENGISQSTNYTINVEDSVTGITLKSAPNKTIYKHAENIDLTGAQITVTSGSGSEDRDVTEAMIGSTYNANELGEQTVTITYEGFTTTFNVTVEDWVTDINLVNPTKLGYEHGDSLDLAGGSVTKIMSSGETQTSVDLNDVSVNITGFNGTPASYLTSQIDTQTITVEYAGIQKTFEITITNTLTGIEVTTNPSKTTFNYGDELDVAEGKITLTRKSGSEIIDLTSDMVSEFNSQPVFSEGTTIITEPLTVSYTENGVTKTGTYSVDIVNDIESISIKTNPQTIYNVNGVLNVGEGKIDVTYADGSVKTVDITTDMITSGFNTTTEGSKTVEVSYTENGVTKTATYTIEVTDTVIAIQVETAPTKTVYKYGESVDLAGAEVTATKGSGTSTIPNASIVVTNYDPEQIGKQTITLTYAGESTTQEVEVYDYVTDTIFTAPSKTTYNYGDTLDVTGGKFELEWASEKANTTIDLTAGMMSGYTATTLGTQNITATYNFEYTLADGTTKIEDVATGTYDVTVENKASAIEITAPAKTEYKYGESLEFGTNEIEVTYLDGSTETKAIQASMVTDKATSSAVNMSPASSEFEANHKLTKTLVITYTEDGVSKTIEYDIEITNDIQSIAMAGTPKTVYNMNDTMNEEDITVTRAAGDISTVKTTDANISGFDTTTEGTKTVEVSYTENGVTKTTTYTIEVTDTVIAIQVETAPTKTVYKYGESIDLAGAEVTATKGSGTSTIPNASIVVTNYDPEQIGKQTITLTYAGESTTQEVEVYDYVTDTIFTAPSKTTYNYGDTLDVTGGKFELEWASEKANTTIDLTAGMMSGYASTTLGTQNITATYNFEYTLADGTTKIEDVATGTYDVTVENKASAIEITAPAKTEYKYGESLEFGTNEIEVTYLDGSTETKTIKASMVTDKATSSAVNMSPASSEFEENHKLTKTLVITYTEDGVSKTIEYDIEITNDIQSIAMAGTPKTVYNMNDTMNEEDITVTRAAGDTSTVTTTDANISGFDTTTEGTKTVEVSYTENGVTKTTTYTIEVTDTVIAIQVETAPTKTVYKYGESVDLAGAEVTATKGSGTSTIPNASIVVTNYDPEQIGKQTITLTYAGESTTQEVEVYDYVTDTIFTAPSKTTYNYGDTLDITGGKFELEWASEKANTTVDLTSGMMSGYTATTLGTQNVTATYSFEYTLADGTTKIEDVATGTYDVTVENKASAIEITAPAKTEYKYGESLEFGTDEIEVTYLDGSTETKAIQVSMVTDKATSSAVNMNPASSEFEANHKLTKTLEITYTEDGVSKTIEYDIEITNDIQSITMAGTPKTVYNMNDTMNEEDITVTRAAGDTSTVTTTDANISGFDTTTEGTKTVEVSYTENGVTKTTTYTIEVTDTVIAIQVETAPTKTVYKYGESVDLAGAEVTATKGSGTSTIANASIVVTNYDPEQIGKQTITLTYAGESTTQEVEVYDYVTGAIFTAPSKTTYNYGDTLDVTGGKFELEWASEKANTTIDLTAGMMSGYASTTLGTQNITATYNFEYTLADGTTKIEDVATGTYDVTVENKASVIEITAPAKTEYKYGESLEFGTDEIEVTYLDGSTETKAIQVSMVTDKATSSAVNMNPASSEFEANHKLTKTLVITYTEDGVSKTIEYDIEITNDIQSIAMAGTPKTVYNMNDTMNEEDITVTRAAGDTSTITTTDANISGFDTTTEGTKTVEVSYTENGVTKTTTYTIEVTDTVIAIQVETAPTKTVYKYGESIDLAGAEVTATKGSGTSTIPNASIVVTNYDPEQIGKQTITLTYAGESTTQEVEVYDYVTDTIFTAPSKTTYNYGDTLDVTGGKFELEWASEKANTTVDLTAGMMSGYTATTLGTQNITATYNFEYTLADGTTKIEDVATGTYDVTVENKASAIEITAPAKTEYKYGESLEFGTDEIEVTYLDGSTETKAIQASMVTDKATSSAVNMSPASSEFEANHKLTKTLEITYSQDGITQTKEYDITIIDYLDEIEVKDLPKTIYSIGETEIDVTGGTLEITRASGKTETVSMMSSWVSGLNTSIPGTYTLIVQYQEGTIIKTTTYDITVSNDVSEIQITIPTKTKFSHGDTLIFDGGQIKVLYADGTFETKSIDETMVKDSGSTVNMSPSAADFAGDTKLTKTLTIEYTQGGKSKTETYDIEITNTLKSIEITNTPKTVYTIGETLDLTGGTLEITRAAGTETVSIATAWVQGFDTSAEGTKTVSIDYIENGITKTVTYQITIQDPITGIVLKSAPTKSVYKYGESFAVAGGQITITKSSGAEEDKDITLAMISNYNATPTYLAGQTEITQTIEVTYEGFEVSFDVKVQDELDNILLVAPTKLTYEQGEALNLTGGSVAKVMKSGNIETAVELDDAQVSVTGYNSAQVGAQTITVNYAGKQKTFTVIVIAATVNKIEISTPITKTEYKFGESLDLTGGKLLVTYSNNTTDIIDMDSSMIKSYNSNQLGTQNVVLEYAGKTVEFEIEIEDYTSGIRLVNPTKLLYKKGESLDLTGGKIEVLSASGVLEKTVELTDSNVTISGYNANNLGVQYIKVEYETYEGQFNVVVQDEVTGMVIESLPNKSDYTYGELLDLAGGKIKLIKESGAEEILDMTDSSLTVSGYNKEQLGTQKITIKHSDKSVEFAVTVTDVVKSIEFVKPTKSSYVYGEALSVKGGKFIVVMASGAKTTAQDITTNMVSGFNSKVLGKQTVTVTYEGKKYTFTVTVTDTIKNIIIDSKPKKDVYELGEELDLTGAKIIVNKLSGEEVVTITNDMVSGYDANKLGVQTITVTYNDGIAEFTITVKEKAAVVDNNKNNKPVTEDTEDDSKISKGLIAAIASGIASLSTIMILLALADQKKIRIMLVEAKKEKILAKESISINRPVIDLREFMKKYAGDKLEIVIPKYLAKKLDNKTIQLKLNNEISTEKIKYNGKKVTIPVIRA